MDFTGAIHDFILVFFGSILLLGGLGVVLLTNPIFSAFSLGLVLVCISLFIPPNFHFVAAAQLLIYVGGINVLIVFVVMFMNDSECSKDFSLWTVGEGVTPWFVQVFWFHYLLLSQILPSTVLFVLQDPTRF